MSEVTRSKERDLLMELCRQRGVNPAVVEELLKIEKEYQFRDRRHGVYDRLRECIRSGIGSGGTEAS